jgi:Macrocin-O-methyltransferase (TylF)
VADSDRYFEGRTIIRCADENEYWNCSIAARPENGQILEFGVAGGQSLNYIADRIQKKKIYGFDSFQGLPERWYNMGVGTFKLCEAELNNLPNFIRPNAEIVMGLFEDTLPWFVEKHPESVSLLHVDCDIYSSTKTVFKFVGPLLVAGTIIMFDEYIDYDGWQEHEYKAFQEFIAESGRAYEYLFINVKGFPYPSRVSVRMK